MNGSLILLGVFWLVLGAVAYFLRAQLSRADGAIFNSLLSREKGTPPPKGFGVRARTWSAALLTAAGVVCLTLGVAGVGS